MLTDSLSRRGMLRSSILGTMLFPGLLSELMQSDAHASDNPLAPKKPHFKAKAKRVIFLFMTGGVSHVDTFDHKPKLFTDVGREVIAHTHLDVDVPVADGKRRAAGARQAVDDRGHPRGEIIEHRLQIGVGGAGLIQVDEGVVWVATVCQT